MSRMLVPPPLRPGDRVRVIAPSGPFDRTLALRGMGFLAQRYRVEFAGWELFRPHGFLAGDDARRLAELERALSDPGVAAVVAARGGYGAGRIVAQVNWRALLNAPRWLVGFSDVTALHVEAQALGVASLHAPMVAGLGRADAVTRDAWVDSLEAPLRSREFSSLKCVVPGCARGPLAGGNLTLLVYCALAGRWRPAPGAVLFLEDVTEAPYRIDRMLTALLGSGALAQVAAVVLGEFTDCPPGRFGVSAEAVLAERLALLGVPVVAGVPAGHGRHNFPLHLGLPAQVDAAAGVFVTCA